MFTAGGGAGKDALVRKESYPIRAAFNARFVGRDAAGDTKRKPTLNCAPGWKIESERRARLLSGQADRKIVATASCKPESETDMDEGPNKLHRVCPICSTQSGGHGPFWLQPASWRLSISRCPPYDDSRCKP